MKKLVIVLFVFCSVLFIANPILKSSFANDESKSNSESTKVEKPLVKETKPNKTLEANTVSDIDNSDSNKDITTKEVKTSTNKTNSELEAKNDNSNVTVSDNTQVTKPNETNKKQDVVKTDDSNDNNKVDATKPSDSNNNNNNNVDTTKPNDSDNNEESSVAKALTKEDALNLLLDMNPNLAYQYQGDENTFPVLKDKGLSGYVFLPNADTDLGYFVDKNTSSIYYFHPSGYLEKIR